MGVRGLDMLLYLSNNSFCNVYAQTSSSTSHIHAVYQPEPKDTFCYSFS